MNQGFETEVVSLTEESATTLPMVADWTDKTDKLGEVGPPGSSVLLRWDLVEGEGWQVAVEMAVARDIGMRQRPLPCKYCMAEPMSSSMSLATWCSVTVMLSLLFEEEEAAVCVPLEGRPTPGPPAAVAFG